MVAVGYSILTFCEDGAHILHLHVLLGMVFLRWYGCIAPIFGYSSSSHSLRSLLVLFLISILFLGYFTISSCDSFKNLHAAYFFLQRILLAVLTLVLQLFINSTRNFQVRVFLHYYISFLFVKKGNGLFS